MSTQRLWQYHPERSRSCLMSSQVLLAEPCPYSQNLPLLYIGQAVTALSHVYLLQKILFGDAIFMLKTSPLLVHDKSVYSKPIHCFLCSRQEASLPREGAKCLSAELNPAVLFTKLAVSPSHI